MTTRIVQTYLLILLGCLVSEAQTLKGRVIDSNKLGIVGANIIHLSSDKHTHSDINGHFIINELARGDSIKISHVGFESRYMRIDNLTDMMVIVLNEQYLSLKEVTITPESNNLRLIPNFDLQVAPVNSSQEILRSIPGLFIGQHAGGGKAEQIFLRGFDIDHGTDIAISVDGMPVNMVSHAHGQGYADLHFLIPETINNVDFGKGLYNGSEGNFATAGHVNFQTKEALAYNSVKMEVGQFNTFRTLGMFDLISTEHNNAYVATEYLISDGPFESPQNFDRFNIMAKYTGLVDDDHKIGITFSHFNSSWDASGQIPVRAVNSGQISRFGAIDDTEGGTTARTNVALQNDKSLSRNSHIKNQIYYSRYNFLLFSNFTFFLDDPLNGDQIMQREDRDIFGGSTDYFHTWDFKGVESDLQAGISIRNDKSHDNELSHTVNRTETLEKLKYGDIHELNLSGYVKNQFNFGKWAVQPALRYDYFDFNYNDQLSTLYETQSVNEAILSPKINFLYTHSKNLQLYFKAGKGFHSNDTRVVVERNGERTLPAALGFDAGILIKPVPQMLVNATYWQLNMEQEFVYVGDAGIVEPGGETVRKGIDLTLRYQPLKWLFYDLDMTYTHAREVDEEGAESYIPLAPDFTMVSSINVKHSSGLTASVKMRYLDDRSATPDNSIIANGYTVVDLSASYRLKNFVLGIQIENLLDAEWNEAQFATESRLENETESVEEIHFTPGTPFNFRASLEYRF